MKGGPVPGFLVMEIEGWEIKRGDAFLESQDAPLFIRDPDGVVRPVLPDDDDDDGDREWLFFLWPSPASTTPGGPAPEWPWLVVAPVPTSGPIDLRIKGRAGFVQDGAELVRAVRRRLDELAAERMAEERRRLLGAATVLAGSDAELDRQFAVDFLYRHGGPEAIALLRQMLGDPYKLRPYGYRGKWVEVRYPVRARAEEALEKLQAMPATRPVISEPDDLYGSLPYAWLAIAATVAGAIFVGVRLLTAKGYARPWLVRCTSFSTGLALVLCGVLAALAVRSAWHVDQVVFQGKGMRWEVCSAAGAMQVTAVERWWKPTPLAYVTFRRGTELDEIWDTTDAEPRSQRSVLGIRRYSGPNIRVGERDLTARWHALVVPWPYVCGLVLAPVPLHYLTVWWMARRWRRRDRCPRCGYDIRGITGRCPECGREVPPVKSIAQAFYESQVKIVEERRKAEATYATYAAAVDQYHDRLADALGGLADRAVDPAAAMEEALPTDLHESSRSGEGAIAEAGPAGPAGPENVRADS